MINERHEQVCTKGERNRVCIQIRRSRRNRRHDQRSYLQIRLTENQAAYLHIWQDSSLQPLACSRRRFSARLEKSTLCSNTLAGSCTKTVPHPFSVEGRRLISLSQAVVLVSSRERQYAAACLDVGQEPKQRIYSQHLPSPRSLS